MRPRSLFLAALAAISLAAGSLTARAQSCSVATLGNSPNLANTYVLPFDGRAWGETFRVQDTLVTSITVWRDTLTDTNYTALQLFITRVDPTGRPIPWDILLTGPTLEAPITDGVHPLAVKYVLDPPFALPSKGTYFFAIKDADCPSGEMPLLADTLDSYPNGRAWKTVPLPDCSALGQSPRSLNAKLDLEFQIEFCSPTTGVGDGATRRGGPSLRVAGSNPARHTARLEYTLKQAEAFDLTVVDVAGRRIATLGQGMRAAGRYEVDWDGRGPDGSRAPPGVYLVRLETPSGMAVERVPLLR